LTDQRRSGSPEDAQLRFDRIDRLLKEVRELHRKNRAILDDWRAKGILPPEEPRRRV
jgi:hypothetical protein